MSSYCRNCSNQVPATEGLTFDGDTYCSQFCAEVAAGFWSQGGQ